MKKKREHLSKKEYTKTLDLLYTAASSLQGRDAVKLFLKDLLTPSERIMLGRRIWIARMLLAGYRYRDICKELKVAPNTVRRIEQWLNDQLPGYEKAIKGLEQEMDERAIRREIYDNPFGYAALKRKYPLHFLLFPAPKPKKRYRP